MKRLLVLVMVALLAMGALASVATAATAIVAPPAYATGGQWESVRAREGSDPSHAIVFRVPGGVEQYCNITPRDFDVNVRAYVAQWAEWEVDFGGWEWYVRKPGTFFGDCITAKVSSNGQVTLSFDGFGNLVRVEPDPEGEPETNLVIPTRFGFTIGTDDPVQWVAATAMDELELVLEDNTGLHNGRTFKLWNEIQVVNCNSPGYYAMGGTVTMTLDNQPAWIVGETGLFNRLVFNETNGYVGVPAAPDARFDPPQAD